MDEWESEIDRLKDLADKAVSVPRLSCYNQIEELSLAEDDIWENLKSRIESTCNDLGEAVKEAASQFK